MKWEMVIGLEVHAQLSTKSKLFSGAATTFGVEPNHQACPVDLAYPGMLPVLNPEVFKMAVKFGLAVGAHINHTSIFARKNYFYADLPKGYQISQFEHPIVGLGKLDITLEDGSTKTIGITRAHLEEDAGKSTHDIYNEHSAIDLNRAGIPLLEIVSEPDMRSAKEAIAYLKSLHSLLRYLDISDANMQEGSFRCDVNLSLRKKGEEEFGTRTEMKNLNSFRFIERAILYEANRQREILEAGGVINQETLQYDPNKNETKAMRSKEQAHDYRYFPDPDLLPVEIDESYIAKIKETLPELPWEKKSRFQCEYNLSAYDASVLTASRSMADFFQKTLDTTKDPKITANWIMGEVSAYLNKENITIKDTQVGSEQVAALIKRIQDNTISNSAAKTIFEVLWEADKPEDATLVDSLIEEKGLKQISDTGAIEKIIDEILANNPDQVAGYKSGKTKLFGFFVGQTMKATQGKANPKQVNDLLKNKLD
jgi:aspartyl-tRNA(Asn)/glutamyl-tRNA(Gln) amidotransferase subunit B